MWKNTGKIAFVCVVALVACSCGSVSKNVRNAFPSQYDVGKGVNLTADSYVTGNPPPVGATFEIFTPKERENDMEYKEYAGLLSAFMIRSGYVPATERNADYSIVFNYSIDGGRTERVTQTLPTYGVISRGGNSALQWVNLQLLNWQYVQL